MTQTCEISNLLIPTRPRASSPLPILISVPNLSTHARGARPKARRRRLRREVRVAGYALIALLPVSMALLAFSGGGFPTLAAGLTIESQGSSEPAPIRAAVISLEPLEPMVTVHREAGSPVILPGYLLPADTSEESSDGGH